MNSFWIRVVSHFPIVSTRSRIINICSRDHFFLAVFVRVSHDGQSERGTTRSLISESSSCSFPRSFCTRVLAFFMFRRVYLFFLAVRSSFVRRNSACIRMHSFSSRGYSFSFSSSRLTNILHCNLLCKLKNNEAYECKFSHWCKGNVLVVKNCFTACYIITIDPATGGLGGQTIAIDFVTGMISLV